MSTHNFAGKVYNPEEVNTRYLYYFLLSQTDAIKKLFIGGDVKMLKMSKFFKINVPIPPMDIQLKIVELADFISNNIPNLIENLEQEKEDRELQWQYYLKSTFLNLLNNDSVEKSPIYKLTAWSKKPKKAPINDKKLTLKIKQLKNKETMMEYAVEDSEGDVKILTTNKSDY